MQVVVLAGGLGTRMRPRTDTMPKALLPVAGRPFAERQVELLAAHGVEDVVFSIAYLGHMIRDTLGDGSHLGVRIRYVDEGEARRGTGGAVRLSSTRWPTTTSRCCTATPTCPSTTPRWDAYAACGQPALMTVIRNHDRWDASNAEIGADGLVRYRKGGAGVGFHLHDYWSVGRLGRCRGRARTARRRERSGRAVHRSGRARHVGRLRGPRALLRGGSEAASPTSRTCWPAPARRRNDDRSRRPGDHRR